MEKLNKPVLISLMFFGLLLLAGCDKVKILKVEEVLDGGSVEFLLAPQSSMDYDVSKDEKLDIEALIKPYNLSLDQVKSLKLESAVAEVIDTAASPVNFDITENMSSELGTTTIPLTKIAGKDPVPHTGLIQLNLDVQPDVDIIPFAKANDINYHLKLKLNKALTHQIQIKVSVKWKVKGEI